MVRDFRTQKQSRAGWARGDIALRQNAMCAQLQANLLTECLVTKP
jgi:hypothetical protein